MLTSVSVTASVVVARQPAVVSRVLDQPLVDRVEIGSHDVRGRARQAHLAVVEPDRALAHHLDRRQVVRHEQNGSTVVTKRQHLADRAVLEGHVADGQHLVDQQHVGVDVGGDREAESRVHARRVALERRVDKRPEVGKLDDVRRSAARTSRRDRPRMTPLSKMFSRPVSSG